MLAAIVVHDSLYRCTVSDYTGLIKKRKHSLVLLFLIPFFPWLTHDIVTSPVQAMLVSSEMSTSGGPLTVFHNPCLFDDSASPKTASKENCDYRN